MDLSNIIDSLKTYPIAVAGVIVAIATGAYLYFTADTVTKLERELQALQQEDRVFLHNSQQGVSIDKDFEKLSEQYHQIEASLMDPNQIAINNGYFYDFSDKHPVKIENVSQGRVYPVNPKPMVVDIWSNKSFPVLSFSMDVNGLLTDMIDMFYRFDGADVIIEPERFVLQTSAVPEVGYMAMNLELKVLGKPEEKPKPLKK